MLIFNCCSPFQLNGTAASLCYLGLLTLVPVAQKSGEPRVVRVHHNADHILRADFAELPAPVYLRTSMSCCQTPVVVVAKRLAPASAAGGAGGAGGSVRGDQGARGGLWPQHPPGGAPQPGLRRRAHRVVRPTAA